MSKQNIKLYRVARKKNLGAASQHDLQRTQAFEQINSDCNNRIGVLYIHGYTSTPHSVRTIAETLMPSVHYTATPLLAGHGTNPMDMGQSTYQDWYQSVKLAYQRMAPACEKVMVVGQSLGALLATMLAHEFSAIDSVIMLVPAFYPPAIINLTPLLSPLLNALHIKTLRSVGGNIKKTDGYEIAYNRIHVNAPLQLYRACLTARQQLPKLKQDIIMVGSKDDPVLPAKGIKRAFATITSKNKKLVWLENSYHVASVDNDAEIIIDIIKQKIRQLAR